MLWNYRCPNCGRPLAVEWSRHKDKTNCRHCRSKHYPPTPDEDHFAYISGAKWPLELEKIVVARKGSFCSAPNCFQPYQTLTLRQPLSKGGKLSLDNLIPVCAYHAREKGEQTYEEWIRSLTEKQPEDRIFKPRYSGNETKIGFDTNDGSNPDASSLVATLPVETSEEEPVLTTVQLIARESQVKLQPILERRPIIIAPFLRGLVNRLVFDYEWEIRGGGDLNVYLTAWSKGQQPKLEHLGTPEFDGLNAVKRHTVTQNAAGQSCLTLILPPAPLGRWTAAVFILGDGAFVIKEFVLAGCD